MKKTFITIFVLLLFLNLLSYLFLPDRIAVHFGKGGFADSWAKKEVFLLVFSGFEILLFLAFFYTPFLVMKTPKILISLPNKSFWLKEENKTAAIEKLEKLMYEFGSVIFSFMAVVTILILDAHSSDPVRLKEKLFFPLFIIYMVYCVYFCVKIFLSFRIPREHRSRP